MIRHACFADIEQILDIAEEANRKTDTYRELPPNREKAKAFITAMVPNPKAYIGVVDDNGIQGIVISMAAESWAHDGLIISDILFYARRNGRALLKHYIEWVDGFPQPKVHILGITFGGENAERTEQFYQHQGFTKVGAHFTRGSYE
jgi:hypothetical protein